MCKELLKGLMDRGLRSFFMVPSQLSLHFLFSSARVDGQAFDQTGKVTRERQIQPST